MQALPVGAQHALRHGRAPPTGSGSGFSGLGMLAAELSEPVPPLDLPRSLPSLGSRASPASSRVPDRVHDRVPGPWRTASAQSAGASAAGSVDYDRALDSGEPAGSPRALDPGGPAGSPRALEPGEPAGLPNVSRSVAAQPEEPAAGPSRDLEPDPDPYYDPEPEPDPSHVAGLSDAAGGEGEAAEASNGVGVAQGASAGRPGTANGQTESV